MKQDSISVYVMNHKSRSPLDVTLAIIAQDVSPTVVTDESDYRLIRNEYKWKGVYDNFRRILLMINDQKEEWGVILHDDVSVPAGLFDRIRHILKFAPKGVLSFYNPTNSAYQQAAREGKHVVVTYRNFWTQCICFHRSVALPIHQWGTDHVMPGRLCEDIYLNACFTRTKQPVHVIVPSLIQHEGYARSTHGIPAKVGKFNRNSATYDPSFDVTKIEWKAAFQNPLKDLRPYSDTANLVGV